MAEAGERTSVPRLGVLAPGVRPPSGTPSMTLTAFRKALAELGRVEGETLIIDERWQPPGKENWLQEAAEELAGADVDAIFALGALSARALKATGNTIPTVFVMVIPTEEFVSDARRPEANMTGFTTFDPALAHTQLLLLKRVFPDLQRVAFFGDEAVGAEPFRPHESAARALNLEPLILKMRAPQPDLDAGFEAARRLRADAVVVLEHPITIGHRKRIAEHAAKHRIATLFPRDSADADGLLSYGTPFSEAARRAAMYVDRILKGARANELPVETVHRPEFIVNLRMARALSVSVPDGILNEASSVIR